MILLFLAVALFAILHLIPVLPELKTKLKDRCGGAYTLVFSLAASGALVAIFLAWSRVEFIGVYEPVKYSRYINMAFSLVSFMFLAVFFFRGKLRQFLRFPLAIAIMFWAVGHLVANGDQASIVLFGGFLIFGIVFIALGLLNKVFPSLVVRDGHDILSLVIGVSVYIAMVQLHEILIGVPVIRIDQIFGG